MHNSLDLNRYFKRVKLVIKQKKDYDTYRYIYRDYINFLETLLVQDPTNIKAICQLAISYYADRRDEIDSIAIMEEAIEKYDSIMSNDSLCEILNNLAYFYDVVCNNAAKAEILLKRSVQLNSPYQNSYYALAYISADANPSFALKIMNTIPQKENLPLHYQYLYACVMIKNKLYEEALQRFKLLFYCDHKDISEKSIYCCSIINIILNKKSEALQLAEVLYGGYKRDTNEEISTFELIYLYFQLQDYAKVIGLFSDDKTEDICIDVQFIRLYFYSLKKVGDDLRCKNVYTEKLDELTDEIKEIMQDKDFNDQDRKELVELIENDIMILTQNYNEIALNKNPFELDDVFYYCDYPKLCYLIDCPVHS